MGEGYLDIFGELDGAHGCDSIQSVQFKLDLTMTDNDEQAQLLKVKLKQVAE